MSSHGSTDWVKALEHVSPTPDGHQKWVDAGYAREILRCSNEEITRLRSSGIQTRGDAFDLSDLWNVGLYSGTGASRPELEMTFFGLVVSPRRDWIIETEYSIALEAACPHGNECVGGRWEPPQLMRAQWHDNETAAGWVKWTGEITISGHPDTVRDPQAKKIWDTFVTDHSFHYPFMRGEQTPALTRSRRVGNCVSLSAALHEELTGHGLSSRIRDGFLFSGRKARIHRWVEFKEDDRDWKPLDPSMAILASRFFTPEYARFCEGSSLNLLARVAPGDTFHVHHWCTEDRIDLVPTVTIRKN
ncbi:hypothetical protein IDM40_00745 [Nocardiopsis sp. HNM0947]|uniref:Transglutaminase-like domain-containing protein n=1 Tax=Nocardiopsis coralli TaxID=2772213 RepID=A0ABR9P068_9ACTN|nr:transglutaminase domain-containing protein [Nocardiopsis coralli]MBE2997234.1 hypothetical protein [Nocardiopsis coralli]